MSNLLHLSGSEQLALIRSRQISAEEAGRASLDRIQAVDARVGAFRCVLQEEALARAKEIDTAFSRGDDPGPLSGLPIAIKDVICKSGNPNTCGSAILRNLVPSYDPTGTHG